MARSAQRKNRLVKWDVATDVTDLGPFRPRWGEREKGNLYVRRPTFSDPVTTPCPAITGLYDWSVDLPWCPSPQDALALGVTGEVDLGRTYEYILSGTDIHHKRACRYVDGIVSNGCLSFCYARTTLTHNRAFRAIIDIDVPPTGAELLDYTYVLTETPGNHPTAYRCSWCGFNHVKSMYA